MSCLRWLFKHSRKKIFVEARRGPLAQQTEEKRVDFPSTLAIADKRYLGCFEPVGYFHDSPFGVTVHYTANNNISATIKELGPRRLGYHFIIERGGTIYQCCSMRRTLSHAGPAVWNGRSPNHEHIAIALVSWGHVDPLSPTHFSSWANKMVPAAQCERFGGRWWQMATEKQEDATIALLEKLVSLGIPREDICGHDEAALPKGRKQDPGGVFDVAGFRQRTL